MPYGFWFVGLSEIPSSLARVRTAVSVRPNFSPMTRVGVLPAANFAGRLKASTPCPSCDCIWPLINHPPRYRAMTVSALGYGQGKISLLALK